MIRLRAYLLEDDAPCAAYAGLADGGAFCLVAGLGDDGGGPHARRRPRTLLPRALAPTRRCARGPARPGAAARGRAALGFRARFPDTAAANSLAASARPTRRDPRDPTGAGRARTPVVSRDGRGCPASPPARLLLDRSRTGARPARRPPARGLERARRAVLDPRANTAGSRHRAALPDACAARPPPCPGRAPPPDPLDQARPLGRRPQRPHRQR